MKKIYLYSTIFISLLFNLGFFFYLKECTKHHVNSNVSDEYLGEQLDMSYSCLKLDGLPIVNIEGSLWNKGNTVEQVNLQTQLEGINILLYFSELSCSTCIKDHLASLAKAKQKMRNVKVFLVTGYPQNDLINELLRLELNFSVFALGENSAKFLTEINSRYPTATTVLLVKDSYIVNSFVSDSGTNHFNINFYDSIYRYYKNGLLE